MPLLALLFVLLLLLLPVLLLLLLLFAGSRPMERVNCSSLNLSLAPAPPPALHACGLPSAAVSQMQLKSPATVAVAATTSAKQNTRQITNSPRPAAEGRGGIDG